MLQVGMKALVVGCRTKAGEKYIGCQVIIHQLMSPGDKVDPSVLRDPKHEIIWAGAGNGSDGAVVRCERFADGDENLKPEYVCFNTKHLMPIPPLEDPGIDECTFTPIIQKEKA